VAEHRIAVRQQRRQRQPWLDVHSRRQLAERSGVVQLS
jgi:hypothetical protein